MCADAASNLSNIFLRISGKYRMSIPWRYSLSTSMKRLMWVPLNW